MLHVVLQHFKFEFQVNHFVICKYFKYFEVYYNHFINIFIFHVFIYIYIYIYIYEVQKYDLWELFG
jgi:hypothetical protein